MSLKLLGVSVAVARVGSVEMASEWRRGRVRVEHRRRRKFPPDPYVASPLCLVCVWVPISRLAVTSLRIRDCKFGSGLVLHWEKSEHQFRPVGSTRNQQACQELRSVRPLITVRVVEMHFAVNTTPTLQPSFCLLPMRIAPGTGHRRISSPIRRCRGASCDRELPA
jgi:hypothetical protein